MNGKGESSKCSRWSVTHGGDVTSHILSSVPLCSGSTSAFVASGERLPAWGWVALSLGRVWTRVSRGSAGRGVSPELSLDPEPLPRREGRVPPSLTLLGPRSPARRGVSGPPGPQP